MGKQITSSDILNINSYGTKYQIRHLDIYKKYLEIYSALFLTKHGMRRLRFVLKDFPVPSLVDSFSRSTIVFVVVVRSRDTREWKRMRVGLDAQVRVERVSNEHEEMHARERCGRERKVRARSNRPSPRGVTTITRRRWAGTR